MTSSRRTFWSLASILVLADCSSKRAVEHAIPVGTSTPIINDVVRFTLGYNPGAAFSTRLGPNQRWLLIAVSVVILIVLARSYRSMTRLGRTATIGMALVVGGAVGNLLDRLISHRGVVDFIDVGFGASRFYIFNLADAGISIGALFIAYALWNQKRSS